MTWDGRIIHEGHNNRAGNHPIQNLNESIQTATYKNANKIHPNVHYNSIQAKHNNHEFPWCKQATWFRHVRISCIQNEQVYISNEVPIHSHMMNKSTVARLVLNISNILIITKIKECHKKKEVIRECPKFLHQMFQTASVFKVHIWKQECKNTVRIWSDTQTIHLTLVKRHKGEGVLRCK